MTQDDLISAISVPTRLATRRAMKRRRTSEPLVNLYWMRTPDALYRPALLAVSLDGACLTPRNSNRDVKVEVNFISEFQILAMSTTMPRSGPRTINFEPTQGLSPLNVPSAERCPEPALTPPLKFRFVSFVPVAVASRRNPPPGGR